MQNSTTTTTGESVVGYCVRYVCRSFMQEVLHAALVNNGWLDPAQLFLFVFGMFLYVSKYDGGTYRDAVRKHILNYGFSPRTVRGRLRVVAPGMHVSFRALAVFFVGSGDTKGVDVISLLPQRYFEKAIGISATSGGYRIVRRA